MSEGLSINAEFYLLAGIGVLLVVLGIVAVIGANVRNAKRGKNALIFMGAVCIVIGMFSGITALCLALFLL